MSRIPGPDDKPKPGAKPRDEVRRERFVRVAARRTSQVLKDLERLRRCANRAGYKYGKKDVEKIFDAITHELEIARAQFDKGMNKEVAKFTLDDE